LNVDTREIVFFISSKDPVIQFWGFWKDFQEVNWSTPGQFLPVQLFTASTIDHRDYSPNGTQ
jgi:hypothetical protein